MIVTFHLLSKWLYQLCKYHMSAPNQFNISPASSPLAERDAENDIRFDPPMYKQRYQRAADVLVHDRWKAHISKVVDFGCGELGLFIFLKNISTTRELLFVDVDELMLSDSLFRVYPLNADYLVRRKSALSVKVLAGSVSCPDSRLVDADAIIALELIEHLYPDVLDALPYNLFSFVQPKILIFTTPNSEFNVLFDKVDKFRHPDHKFEWTREQFQEWATNIISRFPNYIVQFEGVGLGPVGSEPFGCCSQLAVFVRKDIICDTSLDEDIPFSCTESPQNRPNTDKNSYGICTHESKSTSKVEYKTVATIEYPQDCDTRSPEQKLLDELQYRMNLFASRNDFYYNYEKDRVEVPLRRLLYQTSEPFPTEADGLRPLLSRLNYRIEECFIAESKRTEACVVHDMENDASGSDNEASGYESDNLNADVGEGKEEKDRKSSRKGSSKDNEKPAPNEGVRTQLHLEVNSPKKQQEALFDSGYHKSPSTADDSPPAVASNAAAIPLGYKTITNGDKSKTAPNDRPNKLSNILSVFDNFDKINELDAFRKEKKFFNFPSNLPHREMMKKICQEIAKHPVAGPSRDPKKTKQGKKLPSPDSDESIQDVKAITACILENSLNRIEDDELQRGELIQELMPNEGVPEENQHEEAQGEPLVADHLVENGDLANNNRDLEGNNYPAENIDEIYHLQNLVDNVDHNNVNIDNNNEVELEEVFVEPELIIEGAAEPNLEVELPAELEVAWSSREALFDANSQVDLLDDFDMEASMAVVHDALPLPPGHIAVVIDSDALATDAVLPADANHFPNWLLQIFEEEEEGDDLQDEPHYYCQGDGLGVHPSTVALNDDADDEGTESGSDSTSTSSASGSVTFVTAENQSFNEQVNGAAGPGDLMVLGLPAVLTGESQEVVEDEAFENAEESASDLLENSDSNTT